MDYRQKIISFIRLKGPVLPAHITKEVSQNVLVASAMLSELVANKALKISNTKVGGSPVYYLQGQESKLQSLYVQLNDKEKKAYDLIRGNRVLRDKEQEPVIRAALRMIKDFAVPMEVSMSGNTEIFWKWYLENDDSIKDIIREILTGKKVGVADENVVEDTAEETAGQQHAQTVREEDNAANSTMESSQPDGQTEDAVAEKNTLIRNIQHIKEKITEKLKHAPKEKKELKDEAETPQSLFADKGLPGDKFFQSVYGYLMKNNIKLIAHNITRKETDIDMEVQVPSPLGYLTYYCKAKNKKKCNDGDISNAYIASQTKKMPLLFLTTGMITKKAKEIAEKEFRGINIKQI